MSHLKNVSTVRIPAAAASLLETEQKVAIFGSLAESLGVLAETLAAFRDLDDEEEAE